MIETLLTAAVLSISTNLDNLAVGVTYGVKRFTVGWVANGAIASLSGISTLCSVRVGHAIAALISPQWAESCGSVLLIAIGVGVLLQVGRSHPHPTPEEPPLPISLSLREAILLGLALTLSNIGTGISAGLTHLDAGMASGFSVLSSLVLMGGGAWLGRFLTQQWQRCRLEWVAGLGLVLLGVYKSCG